MKYNAKILLLNAVVRQAEKKTHTHKFMPLSQVSYKY